MVIESSIRPYAVPLSVTRSRSAENNCRVEEYRVFASVRIGRELFGTVHTFNFIKCVSAFARDFELFINAPYVPVSPRRPLRNTTPH